MRPRTVLPFIAGVTLVATSLLAQEPLPASYQVHLANWAYVETLTLDDVRELTSKARLARKTPSIYWRWSTKKVA